MISYKAAKRDFLTIMDYSTAEIRTLLDLAKAVKNDPKKYSKALEFKQLALIFQKTSTRTRISFEVGMNQLGGNAIYMDWRTTNFTLGDLEDEIRCLSRFVDIIMARVYGHKDIELMAKASRVPVINGLSDLNHPCQVLADIQTIEEKGLEFDKMKMVFIGDGSNNVAFSLIEICARLGINLTIIAPKEYSPNKIIRSWLKKEKLEKYITITDDIQNGIVGADVIYTDTFVSMGQESESAQRQKIFAPFQLNNEKVKMTGKKPYIMHCLPAHRGSEITSEVLDSPQSIVYDQAENRLHAQKALLLFLNGITK